MSKKISIIALALLSATVASAEAYTEQYNFKGNGADGYVGSYSECGYAEAYVSVSSQKQLGPNSWSGQYGWLSFSRGDWCTGDWAYGWADLSGLTFNSSGARGATLSGTTTGWTEEFLGCEEVTEEYCYTNELGEEVCETYTWYNCQWDYVEVPVTVDLSWQPTETFRGLTNNQQKGQDFVARNRVNGTTGFGPVSGSLTFDGFSVGDGYGWGAAWAATSGTAWVYHY